MLSREPTEPVLGRPNSCACTLFLFCRSPSLVSLPHPSLGSPAEEWYSHRQMASRNAISAASAAAHLTTGPFGPSPSADVSAAPQDRASETAAGPSELCKVGPFSQEEVDCMWRNLKDYAEMRGFSIDELSEVLAAGRGLANHRSTPFRGTVNYLQKNHIVRRSLIQMYDKLERFCGQRHAENMLLRAATAASGKDDAAAASSALPPPLAIVERRRGIVPWKLQEILEVIQHLKKDPLAQHATIAAELGPHRTRKDVALLIVDFNEQAAKRRRVAALAAEPTTCIVNKDPEGLARLKRRERFVLSLDDLTFIEDIVTGKIDRRVMRAIAVPMTMGDCQRLHQAILKYRVRTRRSSNHPDGAWAIYWSSLADQFFPLTGNMLFSVWTSYRQKMGLTYAGDPASGAAIVEMPADSKSSDPLALLDHAGGDIFAGWAAGSSGTDLEYVDEEAMVDPQPVVRAAQMRAVLDPSIAAVDTLSEAAAGGRRSTSAELSLWEEWQTRVEALQHPSNGINGGSSSSSSSSALSSSSPSSDLHSQMLPPFLRRSGKVCSDLRIHAAKMKGTRALAAASRLSEYISSFYRERDASAKALHRASLASGCYAMRTELSALYLLSSVPEEVQREFDETFGSRLRPSSSSSSASGGAGPETAPPSAAVAVPAVGASTAARPGGTSSSMGNVGETAGDAPLPDLPEDVQLMRQFGADVGGIVAGLYSDRRESEIYSLHPARFDESRLPTVSASTEAAEADGCRDMVFAWSRYKRQRLHSPTSSPTVAASSASGPAAGAAMSDGIHGAGMSKSAQRRRRRQRQQQYEQR